MSKNTALARWFGYSPEVRRSWLGLLVALVGVSLGGAVPLACGARSSLELPAPEDPAEDAGVDSSLDDAAADAPEDAPEDAPQDGPPIECETPEETYIYVVTSQNQLLSFRPKTSTFVFVGDLDCPAGDANPFSMAVDRSGIAHIVYNNGELFRVSTEDASCESTGFIVNEAQFSVFGMGYAPNVDDDGETLYVADISFGSPSAGLASIDTDTYELSFIAPFSQNPGNAIELTPTGSGPLYGYFLNQNGAGGTLVRVDTETAEVLESTPLSVGPPSSALAVAWWGGRFYIFVSGGNGSEVYRYDPTIQQTQFITNLGQTIVGAGVSTCAPGEFEKE